MLDVRPQTGTVVVGPRAALQVRRLEGAGANWCAGPPGVGDRVGIQVRAHGEEVPGELLQVSAGDGMVAAGGAPAVVVGLERPIAGVAPGQTLAFYDGTRVLGAATLTAARP